MTKSDADRLVQVVPFRILRLDQLDLPISLPLLELFLARNCGDRIVVDFEPDQLVDSISLREAGNRLALVLVHAANDVVRYAEVERSVSVACEEVDVVGPDLWMDGWIPGSALRAAPV